MINENEKKVRRYISERETFRKDFTGVINLGVCEIFIPFFQDENQTVKSFVDALAGSRFDDARAYISKPYADVFDLDELSDYFSENKVCVSAAVAFRKAPRNCLTKSILMREKDRDSVIHLHMVREPDSFGNWKIYGIDKE